MTESAFLQVQRDLALHTGFTAGHRKTAAERIDAFLSGHAHLYQRFTRNAGGRLIPYIVAGSGGHNLGLPRGEVMGKS